MHRLHSMVIHCTDEAYDIDYNSCKQEIILHRPLRVLPRQVDKIINAITSNSGLLISINIKFNFQSESLLT